MTSVLPSSLATGLNALSWLTYQLTTTPMSIKTDLGTFANADVDSAAMQRVYDGFARMMRFVGTMEDARMHRQFVYEGYAQVKFVFLVHAASQIPWGVLSAFQFNNALRTRYPTLHRWTGRVLLASLVPVVVTGVQLVFASRVLSGVEKAPFSLLIGGYPAYHALKGYLALAAPPQGRSRVANVRTHQFHLTKTSIFLTTIPAIRFAFMVLLKVAGRIPGLRESERALL
ncbi:hypothetical protein M427DRAFT_134357 [Gonapodya prolifera JEL478]|uniref:Uncharacterized protein n=1 Tax=Gonapodya prolifera (strain JEL478) TaxID=1344416 RepID=A0A139AHR0_GONPJ|nr:hypothetical protein M427DRAFT_134357 [Gonapodya prolifera JEL478]|eukprot:KXS16346.1 hypothetical protein M427DRAFT_134357 [Gonapodya prolifera JEL478]